MKAKAIATGMPPPPRYLYCPMERDCTQVLSWYGCLEEKLRKNLSCFRWIQFCQRKLKKNIGRRWHQESLKSSIFYIQTPRKVRGPFFKEVAAMWITRRAPHLVARTQRQPLEKKVHNPSSRSVQSPSIKLFSGTVNCLRIVLPRCGGTFHPAIRGPCGKLYWGTQHIHTQTKTSSWYCIANAILKRDGIWQSQSLAFGLFDLSIKRMTAIL